MDDNAFAVPEEFSIGTCGFYSSVDNELFGIVEYNGVLRVAENGLERLYAIGDIRKTVCSFPYCTCQLPGIIFLG